MQFVDVINSVRRHWRLSVALAVLVGLALAGFLVTRSQTRAPDRWRSSVQVLIPYRDEEGQLPEDVPQDVPPRLLQGQTDLALSSATTERALQLSGMDESEWDDAEFEVEISELGDIVTLSATTHDEAQSLELAASFGTAFMQGRRGDVAQGLQQDVMGMGASITALKERLAQVDGELQAADPNLLASLPDTVEPPDESFDDAGAPALPEVDLPPGTPLETELLVYERQGLLQRIEAARRSYAQTSTDVVVPQAYATIVERSVPEQISAELPSPLIPIGVALALALGLGIGVPILLDRVDHSIRDSHTAGVALAAPVLSVIPEPSPSRLTSLAQPGSPRAHAYRTLAAASVATDELPRAIVVTAPVGKMQDSVAANFAAALADLGLRVTLVATHDGQAWYGDPDSGAPTLPDFLAMAHAGRLNGDARDYLLTTPVQNLRILPAGTTESDALIVGLPPLLRALADAGTDVTVIAGRSILEDPSATILAWSTRSVLWVVEAGEVTEQQAGEAAARLELAGAKPFGVALVDGKG